MTELLFVAAIVVVLGIAFVVLSRRSGAVIPSSATDHGLEEEGAVGEPFPIAQAVPNAIILKEAVAAASAAGPSLGPSWTAQFEPRTGTLDDAARLKLINDLGMLRATWCVPLLERAFQEETDSVARSAAEAALARCRQEGSSCV